MTNSQRHVSAPRKIAPSGSCDCHMHIFGPATQYAFSPQRSYTPGDALMPEYMAMCRLLGIDRTVVVHPSIYGTDNRCSLDAVRAFGDRARGVAVIDEDTNETTLKELNDAGFRGTRFNVVTGGGTPVAQLERIAHRVAALGWHIQFFISAALVAELEKTIADLPVDVVFDHIGGMSEQDELNGAGFQALLRLLDSGRAWVKLSGAYRVDRGPAPWPAAKPIATALIERFPERLVWGTDWPHPHLEGRPMPDDGQLLNALFDWVPNQQTLRRILVDNPAQLYDFG